MARLEDLKSDAAVRGLVPDCMVTVVAVQWYGSDVVELTYKTPTGAVANQLLYRHDEPRLEVVTTGRPWSFDGDGVLFRLVSEAQRIRLADAVPEEVLARWRMELNWLEGLPADDPRQIELQKRIAKYEDLGHGACWLRDESIARMVEDALLHFDCERYRLIAWCIMPNHVHVLFATNTGSVNPGSAGGSPVFPLDTIIHSWKSFTVREANKLLKREGTFLFREYHDRYIRDQRHFDHAVSYIEDNPVKAGLAAHRREWRWSSASRRNASETQAVTATAGGTSALPGVFRYIHYAPYLDYRPLKKGEPDVPQLLARPECTWVTSDLERQVQTYAIASVVPEHLQEVSAYRLELNTKTASAVKDRLTKEITYWNHRAEELKLQEPADKTNARLNSSAASATNPWTARPKNWDTTSRAASQAPASCVSSRLRAASLAQPRSPSPVMKSSTRSTSPTTLSSSSSNSMGISNASITCASHSNVSRTSGSRV